VDPAIWYQGATIYSAPCLTLTATFLVILFAPLFYVLIEKTFGKHRKDKVAKTDDVNPSVGDK
jgi:peptidoglycan/LPS O-acetylase OafA/YrhL